jgi:molybdopterin-binding protein
MVASHIRSPPPSNTELEHHPILSPLDSSNDEAYSLPMTLSARNRLEGEVVEIQFGGVMAHVVMRVGKNLIESVITKRSADEMKLKVGDKVSAVIKSTEVMLEKN